MDEHLAARTLADDRAETVVRIASMTADLDSIALASTGSNIDDEHDPEGSTVAFERAQLITLLTRTQNHLADIDAALSRLARLEYGLCEHCHAPIADERLAALPAARTCISCAAQ
jgi:RNA polymerase-binding transcription factor DksA